MHRQIDVFPPRADKFHIRAKRDFTPGMFVRSLAYDLFYPGGGRSTLLIRGHSESSTGAEMDISGYPGLRYRLRGDSDVFSLNRGGVTPRNAPGRATLTATLTRSDQQIYYLRRGEERLTSTNQIELTCNVMELRATAGGYQLTVSGPADMTQYTPVWEFESGEAEESGFAAAGPGRWVCDVDRPQA